MASLSAVAGVFAQRNARIFYAGSVTCWTGSWMQRVATDWLAWERSHDAEFKLKAAIIEQEIAATGSSAVLRARLDAVESEKLDLYQRRYQEYVRVAKALQGLVTPASTL